MKKDERIAELETEVLVLKVKLGLWNATFSKYESWYANRVAAERYERQVLKDYRACSEVAGIPEVLPRENTKSTKAN